MSKTSRGLADLVKPAVKSLMPAPLRQIARGYLVRRWEEKQAGRPVKEIFSAIYQKGKWGKTSGDGFSSGNGSHDPKLVLPYVAAVRKFLVSLPFPPSVVDLGCGDFNVGRQLRSDCARYVACDIVPELIRHNQQQFSDLHVEFRCIDIIEEDLPDGDVVFLRQVLQHLDNAQIGKIVQKLYHYKYLVLTEHVPIDPAFQPNRDMRVCGGVRLAKESGVVLTAAPFHLNLKSESVVCAVSQSTGQYAGLVKTTIYELGDALTSSIDGAGERSVNTSG